MRRRIKIVPRLDARHPVSACPAPLKISVLGSVESAEETIGVMSCGSGRC